VSTFCNQSGLVDAGEAARLLRRPGREAWYLLNLALWWHAYMA
jgi:hypothetical protein